MPNATSLLKGGLRAVNLGAERFCDDLRSQGAPCVHVDWAPPAKGSPELIRALASLDSAEVDAANEAALARFYEASPHLVDFALAKDVIPGMRKNLVLHAGPPIAWEDMCGPMRGAIMGVLILEGFASTPEEAAEVAASGAIDFEPCHHHDTVGPMAGVISSSMVVQVFENKTHGNRAYCPVPEGMGGKLLRYGAYDPECIDNLRWMASEFREVMHAALSTSDGIDVRSLQFQALHMGDEGHNRNKAGTSMLLRALFPLLLKSGMPLDKVERCVDFINGNDGYFLSISMPSSKVCLDVARDVEGSSMVTAMCRNGVEFGIRVSGLGDEWFTGPAQWVDGLYFPGFGDDDANLDMGDSCITETAGIGGFALSGAPAIVQLVGGTAAEGVEISKRMYEITIGENTNYSQPVLNFRGSPTGIDIRKVVETGIMPVITTGSVHKKAGVGQIGAGLTKPPMECFEKALKAFARRYGRE
ncbi:oxamate carbamoyltransferase subunit AllG family protein [Rubneribacter sp.]|nr:DUF1116 domain-containing protein [Candidatus Rubneribacter avistercoris]